MAITLDITGVLQAAAYWVIYWVSNKSGFNSWRVLYHIYVTLVVLSIALDPGEDLLILSVTAFLIYYSRPANATLGLHELLRGSSNHKHPPNRSDYEVVVTLLIVALDNSPIILSGTIFIVRSAQPDAGGFQATALIAEFVAVSNSTFSTTSIPSVDDPPTGASAAICKGFHITNTTLTAIVVLPVITSTAGCYIALSIHSYMRDNKLTDRPRKPQAQPHLRRTWRDNNPTGTWVGTILTGTGLTVIVIIKSNAESNFDIWLISLPFAAAKLIFDCVWNVKTGRTWTDTTGSPDKEYTQGVPSPSDVNRDTDDSGSQVAISHTGEYSIPNPRFTYSAYSLAPDMFRNAQDLIFHGGSFSVVGRDAYNTNITQNFCVCSSAKMSDRSMV